MRVFFSFNENNLRIVNSAGERIGHIGWGYANHELYQSGSYPIGYGLNKEYHRQGIMSRALKAYMAHTDKPSLHAVVRRDNLASQRTLLTCGFTCVVDRPDEYMVFMWVNTNKNIQAA